MKKIKEYQEVKGLELFRDLNEHYYLYKFNNVIDGPFKKTYYTPETGIRCKKLNNQESFFLFQTEEYISLPTGRKVFNYINVSNGIGLKVDLSKSSSMVFLFENNEWWTSPEGKKTFSYFHIYKDGIRVKLNKETFKFFLFKNKRWIKLRGKSIFKSSDTRIGLKGIRIRNPNRKAFDFFSFDSLNKSA